MSRLINILSRRLKRYGIDLELVPAPDRKIVTLKPQGASKGRVLISYIIEPFLLPKSASVPNTHTHYWECLEIVNSFLKRGYIVDVISYRNKSFTPRRKYHYFFGARTNFEGIAKRLSNECIKIAHMDTAHWAINNAASYARLIDAKERRQVISGMRIIENNYALESADIITVLGNEFTINSYAYRDVPVHRIRISTPEEYEWPEQRDYAQARKRFLWFGSTGFVHKGLDLVLEAITSIPDAHLTVCGPIESDPLFLKAYNTELFHNPNIDTVGWVDVSSDKFKKILANCTGVIFPSCSEGGGGSVISCMHGGLIPIVTYESSVDIGNFGVMIKEGSVDAVRNAIQYVMSLSTDELTNRCRQSWQHARTHHTKAEFSRDFQHFVDHVLQI